MPTPPGPRPDPEAMRARPPGDDEFPMQGGRLRRVARFVLLCVALGALLASGVVACPLRALTGVPCPGCGLTRAMFALAAGDPAGAFRHHPLVVLVAPLLAVVVGRALLAAGGVARTATWNVRVRTPHFLLLAMLLLGVWFARFAGHLGGPSDPPDWRRGLIGRALVHAGMELRGR
jgi:hypothetical protein